MNTPSRLLFGLLLLPHLGFGQLSFGSATLLNDGWRFALQDDPRSSRPELDDRGWQRVDLPHDWSVKAPMRADLASCTGYLPGGVAWYRKTLRVPPADAGQKVFVYFEGVYNRSEVYLNGHLLGKRPNGYVSFYYDATPYLLPGQDNVLAVRVDHSRSADSRWYTGSGIYRNVFLVRSGPVHLAPWGLFARAADVQDSAARLQIDAEIQNETGDTVTVAVVHELRSAQGTLVATGTATIAVNAGSTAKSKVEFTVRDPQRWSPDHPNLYRLETTVSQDGRRIDGTSVKTGIRQFAFDPDHGFSLNDRGVKLKGVCLHHDAGVLGAAVPRSIWRARLQTLRSIGCNAVRTSHNPQSPDFYELCDELGLLVLNEFFDEWEFPKRKWLQGWNVGKPGFEGSFDFFEQWSDRDIADVVRRDRNHPSVFAWSIGNEVDYPNDPYSHPILQGTQINQPMFGGYKPDQPNASRLGAIAKRLAAEVKRHDPSRPVTAALAGVVMSNETDYPGALDVAGYNYTEDRYALDHASYPRRVLYGSENGHALKAWKAARDHDYVGGQFLWTGIDYLGEAGPWPSRGSSAGLLDLTGAVKPRGRFREALWSSHPVLHLGTEPVPKDDRKSIDAWPAWNYRAGQKVRVLCYTNAASVRLLLNGQPVGGAKSYDADTGVLAWDLPFAAGTLEAIGVDQHGNETCRAALRSAGPAVALQVAGEGGVIDRERGVTAVTLQIVDRDGVPVPDAEDEVACRIDGPARLLGLDAGNLRDTGDYADATHRAFHGRLVAWVQATGGAGRVRVFFTAAGLPEAELTLTAQ